MSSDSMRNHMTTQQDSWILAGLVLTCKSQTLGAAINTTKRSELPAWDLLWEGEEWQWRPTKCHDKLRGEWMSL